MKYDATTLGPRVIVKDDRDSSIGRGCQLYAVHFVPVVMDLMRHAVQAFALNKRVATIRWTEGWRSIRTSKDCHENCRAIDFTAEDADGKRLSRAEYESVAGQMRKWLGQDYDVLAHGEGLGLHIHAEYDPKPQRATV